MHSTRTELTGAAARPPRAIGARVLLARRLAVVVAALVTIAYSPARVSAEVAVIRDVSCGNDERVDDTVALRKALAELKTGDMLVIPDGVTCRHSNVLRITTPGVRVSGPGTLLATNESRSALFVDADDVTLGGGLHLGTEGITKRWNTGAQHKVKAEVGISNLTMRDVTVDSSAAAGVMISGVHGFTLDRVTVSDTRADGVHITYGSTDGTLSDITVERSGDDAVSVVGYRNTTNVNRSITFDRVTVRNTTWGCGFNVAGGADITARDVDTDDTAGAGICVLQGRGFGGLQSSERVTVTGAVISRANREYVRVNHGAVLIACGEAGYHVRGVRMTDVSVHDTASPTRQVTITESTGADVRDVILDRFAFANGTERVLSTRGTPAVITSGWTYDGRPIR